MRINPIKDQATEQIHDENVIEQNHESTETIHDTPHRALPTLFSLAAQSKWHVHPFNSSCIIIDEATPNLDFSKELPKLHSLVFYTIAYKPYPTATDPDLGLSKNVALKEIFGADIHSQVPLSNAHMPNVELLCTYGVYRDLAYLSSAMPSLKHVNLNIANYSEMNTVAVYENVAKLQSIEEFTLETRAVTWNAFTFTDQEVEALAKMQSLKKLIIVIKSYDSRITSKQFDQIQLQRLQQSLPNTRVTVHFICESDYND